MGEAITIASLPYAEEEITQRASRNFETTQLTHKGNLRWKVISTVGDKNISFDVKQAGSCNAHHVRYADIKDGTVIPYESLRNLYIANPRNATGHFMVRIEQCE